MGALSSLNYEVEKKHLKIKSEKPGSIDFMNEVSKGRFAATANVNKEGKLYSVKVFDKVNAEGNDAAQREFKNLKTLRHEKIVSLLDAYETDSMMMMKFNPLPSTDVLSYIAERPSYTEQMVADICGQVLDALDYIHWRGKVYLNLEPSNILVTSGRSLGRTVQVKLANFETTQTVSANGTPIKGTYNFDYDTPEETKDNIVNVKFKFEWLYKECTMEGTRLLMWIFKRLPYRRPTLEEIGAHRWMSSADYMLKKRQRAKFPTNRIQNFSREYHRSRPVMEQDSQSFITRIVH